MLLADFHIHTTWSDGTLSMPEVVDLFGRSGHDAIAITDHVVNSDSFLGKAASGLGPSVTRENFGSYLAEIGREARRAWDMYRMVVLPGAELTRNGATGARSAHALAVGLDTFVPADGPMEEVLSRARDAGAATIACHPNEQSDWFANTFYLWRRRGKIGALVDRWELACRSDLFPPVARARLPCVASSDVHKPAHLWAWTTLMARDRRPEAILEALRSGVELGATRLPSPVPATPALDEPPHRGCDLVPSLVDDGLEHNLTSFATLTGVTYEVILSAERESDPAVATARRVPARLPAAPFRLVIDGAASERATNRKVERLVAAAREARGEILLNPFPVSLLACGGAALAASPLLPAAAASAGLLCLLRVAQAALLAHATSATLPVIHLLAMPVKDVLQLVAQAAPLLSPEVTWNGHRARLGPGTQLLPSRRASALAA